MGKQLTTLNTVFAISAIGIILAGCDGTKPVTDTLTTQQVIHLIPARVNHRAEWAEDILTVLKELDIKANKTNVCSVVAIVDQESNFQANPPVANLGNTALKALKEKLNDKLGPYGTAQFLEMLNQKPTPDNSFSKQIKTIKNEKELDALYREMFQYFKSEYHLGLLTGAASIVSGKSIAESLNPVKTLGSMQVHINYAIKNPKDILPVNKLRDYLYTQEGGLYYGVSRLMEYKADYKLPIYRFADYNSGVYSSRNSAIQDWVNQLIPVLKIDAKPIPEDGDLLSYNKNENAEREASNTEKVITQILMTTDHTFTPNQIHNDLEKEKSVDLEKTQTYLALKNLYEDKLNKRAPYAQIAQVKISGPKLSRDYSTTWYANSVNKRYTSCIKRGKS